MKSIQLNDIQYRFWIDNLLRADNAYNVAYSFCIKGSLQVCTLKQSLELLTKEYEPFHATIQQKDMHPYFFVDNKFSIQFTLQECNEVLSDTKINSIIDQQAQIPFHLDQEYPCRFFLLKMPVPSVYKGANLPLYTEGIPFATKKQGHHLYKHRLSFIPAL